MQRLGELWDELAEYDEEDARDAEESQIEVSEGRAAPQGRGPDRADARRQPHAHEGALAGARARHGCPRHGRERGGQELAAPDDRGLWGSGSGAIERPTLNRMIFLPQRPYMVQGSLREQLVYPQHENAADDDAVKAALESVNLEEVLERVTAIWGRRSTGRTSCRWASSSASRSRGLLCKKPTIAFLDEATSALDEPNEKLLYERLRELGIAYVSVGHRSTLKQFHDYLLVLHIDGSWELDPIEPDGRRARESAEEERVRASVRATGVCPVIRPSVAFARASPPRGGHALKEGVPPAARSILQMLLAAAFVWGCSDDGRAPRRRRRRTSRSR
jgi:putative ATP-binding cassette transporter